MSSQISPFEELPIEIFEMIAGEIPAKDLSKLLKTSHSIRV